MGCLLFDDHSFCRHVAELLEGCRNRPIVEIGSLDVSDVETSDKKIPKSFTDWAGNWRNWRNWKGSEGVEICTMLTAAPVLPVGYVVSARRIGDRLTGPTVLEDRMPQESEAPTLLCLFLHFASDGA